MPPKTTDLPLLRPVSGSAPAAVPQYPTPIRAELGGYVLLGPGPSGPGAGAPEGRPEYAARYVRAGRITARGDQPGRFVIPAEVIRRAVEDRHFDSRSCFIDHPGWFGHASLRDLAAVTLEDTVYNPVDQSAEGTIRVFGNGAGSFISDLLNGILEDAATGEPTPNVGLSMVFWPRWRPRDAGAGGAAGAPGAGAGTAAEDDQVLEVAEIRHIESIDFVFGPAADGRIKQALSTLAHSPANWTGYGGEQMALPANVEEQVPEGRAAENPLPRYTEALIETWHGFEEPPGLEEPSPPAGAPGVMAQAEEWSAAVQRAAMQRAAMQRAAVPVILGGSDLPAPALKRLAQLSYETPAALEAAIAGERHYLAALAEGNVIQIGGTPPRSPQLSLGPTSLEQMQLAMDWIFGADQAPLPAGGSGSSTRRKSCPRRRLRRPATATWRSTPGPGPAPRSARRSRYPGYPGSSGWRYWRWAITRRSTGGLPR